MALLDILIICSLMVNGTDYYDCDEQWMIYIYDEKYPSGCDGRPIVGCVFYSSLIFVNKIIPPEMHIGSSQWTDEFGYNPLQHEIEHLRCLCDFHGDKDNPPEEPRR